MNDAVEAAKAPGVFDLNKFISDTSYPVDEVVVHNDGHAVNEKLKVMERLAKLRDEQAEAARLLKKAQRTVAGDDAVETVKPDGREEEILAEIDDWDARIDKSALTIHLQGMAPMVVEEITKKHFPDINKDYTGTDEEQERDYELIARTITKMVDADGNASTQVFTAEDVKALRGRLLEGEYLRLVKGVSRVTLNGALFEIAADASFLGRRSDVAG